MKVLRVGSKTGKKARRREQEDRREIQLSIVENSLHTRQSCSRRVQEVQKESFKTDIFFLGFLFYFYSGTTKDCNAMWEERKKEASERAGAPERERERRTQGNSSSSSCCCCSSRALQSLAMAAPRFRGRSEGPRGVCHTVRVSVVQVRRSDQRAHTHLGGSLYYLEAGRVEVPYSGAENLGT